MLKTGHDDWRTMGYSRDHSVWNVAWANPRPVTMRSAFLRTAKRLLVARAKRPLIGVCKHPALPQRAIHIAVKQITYNLHPLVQDGN